MRIKSATKTHLKGLFFCLRKELRLRGATPELRKLAHETLPAGVTVEDNTPLNILPEDIIALSNNEWSANFTINTHEKMALINGAPVVIKLIDVLSSNKHPGKNGNILRILRQNRVLKDYYCESGGFPNHLSEVWDHGIESYCEQSPEEVSSSEGDPDPEYMYPSS